MTSARPTLFYSWQSDHPKTRNYVEGALKKALENVASDISVEDAPRLDKDTQGEVGAVSITATIKQKISQSKIFLADVSLIDQGKAGRKLANQNVMFELGYAFGKKGENAVMLIANQDFGDAKELPFDIAQNRVIFCSPTKDPNADRLVPSLEEAIRAHLGLLQEADIALEQEDAKEQLVSAIENGKPTTTKAEVFFGSIYHHLKGLAPEPPKSGEKYVAVGERTLDMYQKTLPFIVEFFDVVNTASEYGDMDTIKVAYTYLGFISEILDESSEDEYAALVIQEIASLILGCMAKYGRWSEIGELIDIALIKPPGGRSKYKIDDTYLYPQGVRSFYNHKTGTNYAIPTTPLIQERFINNDKILQAYVSGSLILMLALRFYYPYVSGLLIGRDDSYIPEYLSRLHSGAFALKFAAALGLSSLNKLHERLEEKRVQVLSDGFAYSNRDITHIFEAENLMPINEKVGAKK